MVALTSAGSWVVNRTVASRVHQDIEQDLRRASAVLRGHAGRARRAAAHRRRGDRARPAVLLRAHAAGPRRDARYRNTVAGVARTSTRSPTPTCSRCFDAAGKPVASVGRAHLRRRRRRRPGRPPRARATRGTRVVAAGDRHYQVTATPVVAAGQVAGVLVVGARHRPRAGRPSCATDPQRGDFVPAGRRTGSTLTARPTATPRCARCRPPRPGRPRGASSSRRRRHLPDAAAPAARRARRRRGSRTPSSARSRPRRRSCARCRARWPQLGVLAAAAGAHRGRCSISQRITRRSSASCARPRRWSAATTTTLESAGRRDEIGYLTAALRRHARAAARARAEPRGGGATARASSSTSPRTSCARRSA